jgi:predicted amidophosphoribosyltransferase
MQTKLFLPDKKCERGYFMFLRDGYTTKGGVELVSVDTMCSCCSNKARFKDKKGQPFCSDYCADFLHFGTKHCPRCDATEDQWQIIKARDGGYYSEYRCQCGHIFEEPVEKIKGSARFY